MAKTQKRTVTANKAFQALPVNASLALSTLATETALTVALSALADDFYVISADLTWTIRDLTGGEDPIHVGLANGDLSVAEIKEAINAAPTSRSDIVAREHARRPIRRIGSFVSGSANLFGNYLNDGKPIRTKVKMYLAEGVELNAFAFNASGAALTTGAVMRVYGTLYGRWS